MAAVLTSESIANTAATPTISQTPQAPCVSSTSRAPRYSARVAARSSGWRAAWRSSERPPPATNSVAPPLPGVCARATAGVEHDVAEARRAVVDRRHAQRRRLGVGQPDADRVADRQLAVVREHPADGDGVAAHVAQVAASTSRSSARPVPSVPTPAAVHGLSSPRPWSSPNTSVGSTSVTPSTPGRAATAAADPSRSGAPSRPVTT